MHGASRSDRLVELFGEGAELDESGRRALVDRIRGEDPALADDLAGLLEVNARTEQRPLENIVVQALARSAQAHATPELEDYVDLELIGTGGMGSVYRATQLRPVRRTVAIKTLRERIDSAESMARFEVERQVLARMSHPGIAAVYDAGSDATGHPFLVMEYIAGETITAHCAALGLPVPDRLRLMAKVCDAVQHAHQRGVLHRDLKPNNVLVAQVEGDAQPKVIDFGIAKAFEQEADEMRLHTVQGMLLGTPEYMSPEQFEGNTRAVDTRTDVYALGVLLYELLTDRHPFERQQFRSASLSEKLRIFREEVPTRPSTTRLQVDGSQRPGTVRGERIDPELDWVILKTLEKDPDDRYTTPRELADELRRFLAGGPVEAGSPSAFQRARRFARKYKAWVVGVTAVMTVLSIGLAATAWLAARNDDLARQERQARTQAQEVGARLREGLYRSQMRLGTETMDRAGGLTHLRKLLRTWEPGPGGLADLRGFEWHLLHSVCSQELRIEPLRHSSLSLCWNQPGSPRIVLPGGVFEIPPEPRADWKRVEVRAPRNTMPAALSADGSRIVLSLGPRTLGLFDTADGSEVARTGLGGRVFHCTTDASGSVVACAVEEVGVQVWHPATGRLLDAPETATPEAIALSPNGAQLALARYPRQDATLVVDALEPTRELRALPGRWTSIHRLHFDARGRRLASADHDGTLRVWDVTTGAKLLESDHPDELGAVRMDPAGRRVAVACSDQSIYVHDLSSGSTQSLRGHEDLVHALAWSPDGRQLLTTGGDATARWWAPGRRQVRRERQLFDRARIDTMQIRFGPKSEALYVTPGDGLFARWNLEKDAARTGVLLGSDDPRLRRLARSDREAFSLSELLLSARHPGSNILALVGGPDHRLWLWPEQSSEPTPVEGFAMVGAIEWMPDHRLAVRVGLSEVVVLDGSTGETLARTSFPHDVHGIAAHPTRDLLAIGGADQSVHLWEPGTSSRAALPGHTGLVSAVAFSPDGSRLASGCFDRSVRLWQVDTRTEVAGLNVSERVAAVAFSPDGTRLGAVDLTGRAVVWDTRNSTRPETGAPR